MSIATKKERIKAALGDTIPDLVVRNARIVNVFTKEIVDADIAVNGDLIAGIGRYGDRGRREVDAGGRFVCPGLIDSHVHIESSMVTPPEFARTVLGYGTTTVIADPHEIVNVCGINGMHFMLDRTKNLPMNIFFMMPSCVPATPFESNGADLGAGMMEPLSHNTRIIGLAEVMDYRSLLDLDDEMLNKIELFDHGIIDGHSPGLTGKRLNAYRSTGVATDHECSGSEEALERLRLGMYVQIREGSAARNLEAIVKGLMDRGAGFERCLFCTDDKHLEDIRKEGHIDYNVRKAIKCGVEPIEAIRMATLNAAQCYRLKRLGAIAPGFSADFVVLNDLENFDIESVYYRGLPVAAPGAGAGASADAGAGAGTGAGVACKNAGGGSVSPYEDRNVLNTVRIPHLTENHLAIRLPPDGQADVIRVKPGEILTVWEQAKVKIDGGLFKADDVYSKAAVIERHKSTGNIGLGITAGFGIKGGAIAGTVAHDSHNLIVIGDNDSDMLAAIDEIRRINGGLAVVSAGRVLCALELPIAGLMSGRSADHVAGRLEEMHKAAGRLCTVPGNDPFMAMSFLALPVIPELRITDKGLFDVTGSRFLK